MQSALSMFCVILSALTMEQIGAEPAKKVGLDDYVLVLGPKKIGQVRTDASGLTYCSTTKSLFMVINGAALVVELGLDGSTKRIIKLNGFSDVEGIFHVRDNVFWVVEEGRGNICRILIDKDTRVVDYSAGSTFVFHLEAGMGNKGLEGLSYDPEKKRFFSVKERNPRKIYEIEEPPTRGRPGETPGKAKFRLLWDIQASNLQMSDLSGVHFDSRTGHLLILSDESKCVVETTEKGKEISRLRLVKGNAGLPHNVPQAEGITMGPAGTLYICSEPNFFYVFKRKK
jgi:uncharacterized protein YjiK